MSRFGNYIDSFLIRFEWYRNWCAKRSRKKTQATLTNSSEIEVYSGGDAAKREEERHKQLIARREKLEAAAKALSAAADELLPLAQAEAATKPERRKEIYDDLKLRPRMSNLSEESFNGLAEELHSQEILERMLIERGF